MINLEEILIFVCEYFKVDIQLMNSKSRREELVIARFMYAVLAIKYTRETYEQIGRQIDRNYSTICYAKKTTKSIPFFNAIYERVNKEFTEKLIGILNTKNERDLF